jgi:hypothetical protein
MAEPPVARFNCLNCNAQYKVVRVEADPLTADREITYRKCGAPPASTAPGPAGGAGYHFTRLVLVVSIAAAAAVQIAPRHWSVAPG